MSLLISSVSATFENRIIKCDIGRVGKLINSMLKFLLIA